MKINKKYLILIAIAGFIICLDQVTKTYIHTNFEYNYANTNKKQKLTVIPQFFDITYVRNYGAAFGLLRNANPKYRKIFFLMIPPIALIIILYMLMGVLPTDRWQIVSLSSIFGGAIGNYIDRIQYNYVIDFLDFYIKDSHYPAFNIADMAILGGVFGLVFVIWRDEFKKEKT